MVGCRRATRTLRVAALTRRSVEMTFAITAFGEASDADWPREVGNISAALIAERMVETPSLKGQELDCP